MQFTRNETIALMHENTADALKRIADHVEKFKMDYEDVVELLRSISEEQEAQCIVVQLRDEINKV